MPDLPLPHFPALSPPPSALLNGAALFLDFDGTLVPITDRPDGVHVDADLLTLLHRLRDRLDGRLAIVSGRSIATLRDLGLGDFLLAGTHGLEFARAGETPCAPPRSAAIDAAQAAMEAFVADKPGLLVEHKSISVGLHFRGAPQWADACEALAKSLAVDGLVIQRSKMLFELRPGGADKGSALHALMRESPMAGGTPLFIGDDVTDEDGFGAAVNLGGAGILVGPGRPTLAAWRLEQVAAVRHYLTEGAMPHY